MRKLSSVLLVDDDTMTNFLNELLLQKLTVADRVLVANDGYKALALLDEVLATARPAQPALILLDVKMPGLDGFGFLKAYQQLPAAQQQALTIIILTTSQDARDIARFYELPATSLLTKPLSEKKLQEVLDKYFA